MTAIDPMVLQAGQQRERLPEIGAGRKSHAFAHDADDGRVHVVHLEYAAKDRRVAAVAI